MTIFLWIMGLISLAFSCLWFGVSTGAVHEVTAMVILLIAALFVVGACITGTINNGVEQLLLQKADNTKYKNCPACDEPVREAARVCRYCRCVLAKKVTTNPPA